MKRMMTHIYNVAIKPVLAYGCAAVGLFDKHVTELEKLQGSLIKTALGLSKLSSFNDHTRQLVKLLIFPF